MSVRLSISLFLLGIGMGSPWLVRDWLDARSDNDRANRFFEAVVSFPEMVKSRLRERGNKDEVRLTSKTGEAADRVPYPLASQTRRLVTGILPPSLNAAAGEKIPFLNPSAVPSTPRSRAITGGVGMRLREELSAQGLKSGDPVFLRIFKEEAELELWMKGGNDSHYTLFKVFRIVDSAGRPGPKLREGDGQAPEGFYFATTASFRPETRHHLGLDLGYPNTYDAYYHRTGSDLMIHGGINSAGAFALSQNDIEETYALTEAGIKVGQKVVRINVFPFRMTDRRMDQVWSKRPEWVDFWVNLKEGYDFFENARVPPDVAVEEGHYVFRFD